MGKKNLVKPLQPEVDEKKQVRFEYFEIEAVINKYFESKGGKTPLLVELSDLKAYIQENI